MDNSLIQPYPDDPDGEALRRLAQDGSDLSVTMTIDYSVGAADEATARRTAALVEDHGFDPSISQDEHTGTWIVYCSVTMLATHEGIGATRARLNEILAPVGGSCDGWATFGNNATPL